MSILASVMIPWMRRLSVNDWNAVSWTSRTIHIGLRSALFALLSVCVPVVESLRCDSMPTRAPALHSCAAVHRSSSSSRRSRTPSSRRFIRRTLSQPHLKAPVSLPSSSISMSRAAGLVGSPGIVIIEPQTATTKPAPALTRISRIGRVNPVGAPRTFGS